MTHRFTPGPESGLEQREWDSDGPDLKTNSVCLECNGGWLSELEESASSAVGPLLIGEPATLDVDRQRLVATWSYKTALLMQMLRPGDLRAIPPERFEELHALRRPPSDARIWLGGRRGGNAMHEGLSQINIVSGGMVIPGFFSVLAVGRLVILVAARISPGPERFRIGHDVDPRITVQVWPASNRAATWPPEDSLEDLGARSVIVNL